MIMFNVINETAVNGYKSEFLFVTSLVSIAFGIFIIITKNPVVSVLFLIGLFFTISLHLMLLGLYFIGLSYLLVYVGAVSILFLFILMLINVRISELLTEGKNSIPLAIIAVISFNLTINSIIPYCVYIFDAFSRYLSNLYKYVSGVHFVPNDKTLNQYTDISKLTTRQVINLDIGNVSSKSWDTTLVENNHITSIGNILYTNLFILLIITSLILLLAMVGTIVITVRRKTNLNTNS